MKTTLALSALGITALLSGCTTGGLSQHEVAGSTYANCIINLPTTNSISQPAPLRKPLRLAVAQVGETSPPKDMLAKLEANRDLFASVIGVPAPGETNYRYYAPHDSSQNKQEDFTTRVQSLCRLSRNLGAEHLFLLGGDMTSWQDSNLLRVFNITIIGGMIIPSTEIKTEGKAAGALIDTATCEPILLVSSESKTNKTVAAFYAEEKRDGQRLALRDELTSRLADELLKRVAATSSTR